MPVHKVHVSSGDSAYLYAVWLCEEFQLRKVQIHGPDIHQALLLWGVRPVHGEVLLSGSEHEIVYLYPVFLKNDFRTCIKVEGVVVQADVVQVVIGPNVDVLNAEIQELREAAGDRADVADGGSDEAADDGTDDAA